MALCKNTECLNVFLSSSQVLLRFPWCLQMVQCLQSMCLLDTSHRYFLQPLILVDPSRTPTGSVVCSSSLFCILDHWRERSATGSGFTSATGFPPRGSFPTPPPSTAAPCTPSSLHPTPRHDGPASSSLHRHARGRWGHELPVHPPVPPSSYLLRTG